MDAALNYIMNFRLNGLLGIYLYWVPLIICAIGYFIRTGKNYIHDRAKREEKGGFYIPTDTLGTLIGRSLITVLPVGNILAAVFDVAPMMLGKFFDWIGVVFSQPLVPDSDSAKEKRKGVSV